MFKRPNIYATYYEDDYNCEIACVGSELCNFALCEVMPPVDGAQCCYNEHGACRLQSAQVAALVALINRTKTTLKRIMEEGN